MVNTKLLVALLVLALVQIAKGDGPLILTPYLPNNYLQAQSLSKVQGIGHYPSYSGTKYNLASLQH